MSDTLRLHAPLTLTIERPDGSKSAEIDVYKARRFLEECQSQPTEEKRWERVAGFLAEKLEVPAGSIAENQAQLFQAKINQMVSDGNEALKKSIAPTASSPPTTQASQ